MHGVSGAQYGILMALRQLEGERGVSVNFLAEQLHVRANFITTETNKLRELGLIEKRDNPDDRRGVLLQLSQRGSDFVTSILPEIRVINDAIFSPFTRADFETLGRVLGELNASIKNAAEIIGRLEAQYAAAGTTDGPATAPPPADRTAAS